MSWTRMSWARAPKFSKALLKNWRSSTSVRGWGSSSSVMTRMLDGSSMTSPMPMKSVSFPTSATRAPPRSMK